MSKPLPASIRERNLYMVFELISDSNFRREDVNRTVRNSTQRFLGELGSSKTSHWVIEWDEKIQKGILKLNHRSVDEVRSSLALVSKINDAKIIFHVLGVSGTIKGAREKYMQDQCIKSQ